EQAERLVLEVAPRLLGVGHDLVDRHPKLARRHGGRGPRKERLETLAQLAHPALRDHPAHHPAPSVEGAEAPRPMPRGSSSTRAAAMEPGRGRIVSGWWASSGPGRAPSPAAPSGRPSDA